MRRLGAFSRFPLVGRVSRRGWCGRRSPEIGLRRRWWWCIAQPAVSVGRFACGSPRLVRALVIVTRRPHGDTNGPGGCQAEGQGDEPLHVEGSHSASLTQDVSLVDRPRRHFRRPRPRLEPRAGSSDRARTASAVPARPDRCRPAPPTSAADRDRLGREDGRTPATVD